MNLTRPLVALDIESTGPKPETDRVIELGIVRLTPDGERTVRRWLIHPGREIPADSTAVHGITDADVAHAPRFEAVAGEIAIALAGCDLTGYNLRAFDIPLLRREFELAAVPWPCEGAKTIDTYVVFKEREKRDLANAVRFYCHREHANAHSATSDAEAALDVLLGQLAHYADLPRDLAALDLASGGRRPDWATELGHLRWRDDGDLYVAFGRHDGRMLWEMDDGFLSWVLRNDFPADVKALVRAVLYDRRRPRAPGALPLPAEPAPGDDPDDFDLPF